MGFRTLQEKLEKFFEDDTEDDFENPVELEHSDDPHESENALEVVEDYREPIDKVIIQWRI